MKPKENYPPGVNRDQMGERLQCLPGGHPANETSMLTELQRAYLPALLWLFDANRNRGTGRSTLLAHVFIEFAMRGQEIQLVDLTQAVELGRNSYRDNRRFAEQVLRVAREFYPEHLFTYRINDNTLHYIGRRPR